jgi:hypothetical protein
MYSKMALFTTAVDSLRCEISQHMVLIKCGLKNFAVKTKYLNIQTQFWV